MDPRIIKKTQETLGKAIKRPALTEKLLQRPPFRFIFDIVRSVVETTGFMNGLFTAEELASETIAAKEAKVVFLSKLLRFLGLVTGRSLSADPYRIVSGLDPEKTNEMFQKLGVGAMKIVDNHDALVQKALADFGKHAKDDTKLTGPTSSSLNTRTSANTHAASSTDQSSAATAVNNEHDEKPKVAKKSQSETTARRTHSKLSPRTSDTGNLSETHQADKGEDELRQQGRKNGALHHSEKSRKHRSSKQSLSRNNTPMLAHVAAEGAVASCINPPVLDAKQRDKSRRPSIGAPTAGVTGINTQRTLGFQAVGSKGPITLPNLGSFPNVTWPGVPKERKRDGGSPKHSRRKGGKQSGDRLEAVKTLRMMIAGTPVPSNSEIREIGASSGSEPAEFGSSEVNLDHKLPPATDSLKVQNKEPDGHHRDTSIKNLDVVSYPPGDSKPEISASAESKPEPLCADKKAEKRTETKCEKSETVSAAKEASPESSQRHRNESNTENSSLQLHAGIWDAEREYIYLSTEHFRPPARRSLKAPKSNASSSSKAQCGDGNQAEPPLPRLERTNSDSKNASEAKKEEKVKVAEMTVIHPKAALSEPSQTKRTSSSRQSKSRAQWQCESGIQLNEQSRSYTVLRGCESDKETISSTDQLYLNDIPVSLSVVASEQERRYANDGKEMTVSVFIDVGDKSSSKTSTESTTLHPDKVPTFKVPLCKPDLTQTPETRQDKAAVLKKKTTIILDIKDSDSDGDSDNRYIVAELDPSPVPMDDLDNSPEAIRSTDGQPYQECGALVRKLMDAKRRMTSSSKRLRTGIDRSDQHDRGAALRLEREKVLRDVEPLRMNIQSLTGDVAQLVKSIQSVEEDLDSLESESRLWSDEVSQNSMSIQRERSMNAVLLQPLVDELAELELEIERQNNLNASVKASIFKNETRIRNLVAVEDGKRKK